jgi:Xaa-Pro aminopeptidase
VGLEIAHFEVVEALRQALPDVVFEPVAGDLSEMRKLKMPVEVDLLEHAAKVSSLAMAAALNGAEEGATDREIVQLAIDAMYRNGAEWVSHHIVIVNTPDRQWSPGGKNFWKGDTVMLDLGAYAAGGYCGDLCRIHFVGEPPAAVADAYRVLLEAQNAGIAAAKPGVRCSELQQTIDDVLTKNGLRATPYAMGHGIGLKVMELPCIYRPEFMTYDDTLAAGMVICLEPSTFAEVDGRIIKVAHENTYEVVESGLRQLNPHSTALS